MKKISRRLGIFLLLAILCFTTACSSGSPEESGNQKSYTLADFDGWWYRPVDYALWETSMIDAFKVDAESGTWTIYNSYGFAGSSFDCYVDVINLTLELDILGDAVFIYNGEVLLNDEGGVEYVRGDAMTPFDTASFEGKWYKSGDTENDYYFIEGNTYKLFSSYLPDEPVESGTWQVSDMIQILDDRSVKQMQIEFETPDNPFGGGDYIPEKNNVAFFDDFYGAFYVKEAVIGTAAGESVIAEFSLICSDWNGTEPGDPKLEFSYYGTFDIVVYNEGIGERSTPGKWSFDDMKITLSFNDGATETLDYNEDEITVEYYGFTFKRNGW